MKHFALFILLFSTLLGDTVLKIATYNVENLFDLEKTTFRYKEYKPNGESLWNYKHYKIKLRNIAKVIKDIDADIIGLQEIGSLKALKDLKKELKVQGLYYPYYKIANKKSTAIKVAFLSKIPFSYTKEISVTHSYKYRNILEAKVTLHGKDLYIFNNHWKSKSGPESMRILSAKQLRTRVEEIGLDNNIILLGDFNSDYEEYIKFQRKRRHNDTQGKTGINHILKTIEKGEDNLYNLWYDEVEEKRYSYIYKRKKEALDNIIISQTLLDSNGVTYIEDSISNFSKPYLFKKKNIYRWQMSHGRIKKHKGKGYSDHLPVLAKFLVKD